MRSSCREWSERDQIVSTDQQRLAAVCATRLQQCRQRVEHFVVDDLAIGRDQLQTGSVGIARS